MELNNEQQAVSKTIMLKTFKAFQSICSKYGLTYYAGYGTCLGAIRHKGCIPWDDDMDLLMPREDYERLKVVAGEMVDIGYELLHYDNCKGYYLPFMKFCDANTTLWELKRFPCIIGVYIDIFPLDDVEDCDTALNIFSKYKNYFGQTQDGEVQNFAYYIKGLHLKGLLYKTLHVAFHSFFQKRFKQIEEIAKSGNGLFSIVYCGPYKLSGEFSPKSWFGDGVFVDFEDTKIRVPQDYHSYLKNLYGDYMTPPPVEKQVSHHNIYYFNLDKRLPIEEILEMNIPEEQQKSYVYE